MSAAAAFSEVTTSIHRITVVGKDCPGHLRQNIIFRPLLLKQQIKTKTSLLILSLSVSCNPWHISAWLNIRSLSCTSRMPNTQAHLMPIGAEGCPVGYQLWLPLPYLTVSWGVYFQSKVFGYFSHLVLPPQAEYLFQLLCKILLHSLPNTGGFVSWDAKHILLLSPFSRFSLLCLKPNVHVVINHTNIQQLWRAEDRKSLQTILISLSSQFPLCPHFLPRYGQFGSEA